MLLNSIFVGFCVCVCVCNENQSSPNVRTHTHTQQEKERERERCRISTMISLEVFSPQSKGLNCKKHETFLCDGGNPPLFCKAFPGCSRGRWESIAVFLTFTLILCFSHPSLTAHKPAAQTMVHMALSIYGLLHNSTGIRIWVKHKSPRFHKKYFLFIKVDMSRVYPAWEYNGRVDNWTFTSSWRLCYAAPYSPK